MTDGIDPELLALARVAKANEHDQLGAPESLKNLERAQMLASIESCDHCEMLPMLTPAAHQRWVVEHVHELDCPNGDTDVA